MKKGKSTLLALTLAACCCAFAGDEKKTVTLENFENLSGVKVARGKASFEKANTAAIGNGAIHMKFPGIIKKQLFRNPLKESIDWDSAKGISFWVKGDGSDQYGSITVGRKSFAYICYFSLKNKEWHKITVPWENMIPKGQYKKINSYGALPAGGICDISFGSRWTITHNNAKIPQHEYSIDDVELVWDAKEPAAPQKLRPFAEIIEILKNGKALNILCMGDSITAGTGLAKRDKDRYASVLQRTLQKWLDNPNINAKSHAVGGAKLIDARAWLERDFEGEAPDLVTMMYGYNDKSATFTKESYKKSLQDYINRIARKTKGKTAVLLMATIPGVGPRFVMMDDFADAVRETAKEKGLACFDLQKEIKKLGRKNIDQYFCDMAHPNKKGHKIIGEAIAEFLVKSANIKKEKPAEPKKKAPEPGKAVSHDFESGVDGWRISKDEVALSEEKATSGKNSVKFEMKEKGKSHRAIYTPLIQVKPGQRYSVSAQIYCVGAQKGGIDVFAMYYPKVDEKGRSFMKRISRSCNAYGRWENVSGNIEVPEGYSSMKIVVWAHKDSIGAFYLDDISLTPLK